MSDGRRHGTISFFDAVISPFEVLRLDLPAFYYDFQRTLDGFSPSFSRPWCVADAGWSSPVARQAHNLEVAGSNPAPATTFVMYVPDR
jgi:hypothetical protein